MQVSPEDVARLQPTSDSLNVILKNTHFKDGILAAGSQIQLKLDYTANIPVLIFKFTEPFYDFLQALNPISLAGSNLEWLKKNPVVIRLVLSDTVITDHLSIRIFPLDPKESKQLNVALSTLGALPLSRIREMEDDVYANINKYLS